MTLAIITYALAIVPAAGVVLVAHRPAAATAPPLAYWLTIIMLALAWPIVAILVLVGIPNEIRLYRLLRKHQAVKIDVNTAVRNLQSLINQLEREHEANAKPPVN
jgi:hypothetical protein